MNGRKIANGLIICGTLLIGGAAAKDYYNLFRGEESSLLLPALCLAGAVVGGAGMGYHTLMDIERSRYLNKL